MENINEQRRRRRNKRNKYFRIVCILLFFALLLSAFFTVKDFLEKFGFSGVLPKTREGFFRRGVL